MDNGSPRAKLSELDIAAAWNNGRFLGAYPVEDVGTIEIVHRGSWTHGFGPDFRDAMISINGATLLSGSIELHLKSSGWRSHGHHLDPRYNDVIAHVVVEADDAETRRADGKLVPTLVLDPAKVASVQPGAAIDWSLVGGAVCAETLTNRDPATIRRLIWQLGDARLAAKSARMEARLSVATPGDLLFAEIMDGLGYSANREPMRAITHRLPLSTIEAILATVSTNERIAVARGLLFGVSGFLPISPPDANAAGWSPADLAAAESAWARYGSGWQGSTVPSIAWTRARVRPANHPARRLATAAAIIAGAIDGLTVALLTTLRSRGDVVAALRDLSGTGGVAPMGIDRAVGIATNAVAPFAMALAESSGDQDLGEAAAAWWESLPAAEANEVSRRAQQQVAGESRLPGLGARGQQGLIHLDQTLCTPRRCFECPIAFAVVADGGR